MAKLTRKLELALEVLGQTYDPRLPNIVTYARLAESGIVWNGDKWISKRLMLTNAYAIRVSGHSKNEVVAIGDTLCGALRDQGVKVSMYSPKSARDYEGWLLYIQVS